MRILPVVRMFVWMTILTGVLYPLLMLFVAQLTMKDKANGGLMMVAQKPVGALLIGQKFENDRYFWGRPSFTDYHALPSGGSNLGPISIRLQAEVKERKAKNKKISGDQKETIPSELLFASGSGLDPHISVKTAKFQINRIIQARKLDPEKGRKQLEKLVDDIAELEFGIFQSPLINVLTLNMALNEQFKAD